MYRVYFLGRLTGIFSKKLTLLRNVSNSIPRRTQILPEVQCQEYMHYKIWVE